jgi:multiple sugar transport system permease protein
MNRSVKEYRTGLLLVLPAFILVFFILFLPTLNTFRLSFSHFKFPRGVQGSNGLQNYIYILKDREFLQSFLNTINFAAVSVLFEVLFGIFLAVIINKAFIGRGLVRTVILFPWVLPTALNAIVWRWLFNTDFGFINSMLRTLHIISTNINWLGKIPLAMNSMISVAIWKTSSFIALMVLTGLQTIPMQVYEAAEIDGASRQQQFLKITVPLIIPSILLALLFRSMDALRSFELPFSLTQGGPAGSTQTLSLFGYRQFFQYLKFDLGAVVSVVQFLFILVLGILYIRLLRRDES